ncbi:c-type cytochrome [Brucella pseudogrignonensis]|uniref:c-type cytochrome n=1 Tax=Brucella pseudogrignonensis TaxID=419475 RepID=UPI0038B47115
MWFPAADHTAIREILKSLLTSTIVEELYSREEQLALFLKRPQGMIKRTWMAFPGLRTSKKICDVIAYPATPELIERITQKGRNHSSF